MARSKTPVSVPKSTGAPVLLLAGVLMLVYVGLQFASSVSDPGPLWGLHAPSFLPGPVAYAGWIAILVTGALVLTGRSPAATDVVGRSFGGRWAPVAVAVVAGLVFWTLRVRHDLLGDAYALTQSLPVSDGSHPRQPLTQWIQRQLFVVLGPLVHREGMNPADVARQTVAWGSVFTGVGFVFVARGIGGEILAALPEDRRRVSVAAVATLFVVQGWALLFFGYLENYTFVATVLAAWLWLTLRALRRGSSLMPSSLLFVLAVGLHLSVAAFVLLLVVAFALHALRHRAMRTILFATAAVIVGAVALHFGLRANDPTFSLLPRIAGVMDVARQDQGGGAGLAYLLSGQHVADWLNAQVLLGPVGTLVFVLALVGLVLSPGRTAPPQLRRESGALLMLAAGGLTVVAHWSAVEPALGYARDWDLFAPTSVFVTGAALFVVLRFAPPDVQRRVVAVALLVSLWHTGTWVALNASPARSADRFASLDLGLGRTEVVLARHHLQRDDESEARRWLRRALQVNPANNNAWAMLARLDAADGDVEQAIRALENARDALPRKPEYHQRLVELLAHEGRTDELERALVRWLEIHPDAPDRWLALAQVRLDLADREGMRRALERAASGYAEVFASRPTAAIAVQTGDCLAGLEKDAEAVAWYRRALEIDPQHPSARARLATLGVSPR